MRFSVDAHALGCHLTGNEVYIRNLLGEFAKLDEDSDFIAYLSQPGSEALVPERFQTSRVAANPYRRLGFDLPARLREHRPDLLHVQYTAPLGISVPVVATVHDVSYLEHPQYFTRYRALQLRLTVKRTVEMASRVLTPSEFSRRSILKYYKIDPSKVVVVPNAVSSAFHPVDREKAAAQLAAKYGIRGPFVLMVGDLQPRKNHAGLLEAFRKVIARNPKLRHQLVFVGKETWYSQTLHRTVERSGLASRVRFTGFVEDADLLNFYGASDLFVFPSFYEGFGLPILEAMACGRAVACSDTSAMSEVADGAAALFDPHSPDEIARAISSVLNDPEHQAKLERLGLHRARLFSWERAARLTLDVYYDVAGVARRLEPAMTVTASS